MELPVSKQSDLPEAGAVVAGKHEVINQGAIERLGGAGQPTGGFAIRFTGPRIAAWMIVSEDDPGAAVKRSISDDRSDREFGLTLVAAMPR